MDRATISRIESWDALTVPGGYAGLSELAEDDFTGAVEAGGTRMFMLNGRVIGVFDGTISAFEGAESTAYEAPDPALPLLFAMQERGGEVRGKYYTDDTPLQEVDQTLTDGGFTGYLELSENVLSGDYYVAYYGGRSLAAAFIGNEGRVVTGREAFDLAADEVGIYEVRAVDIEVSELPEPSGDAATTAIGTVEEAAPDDGPAESEPDAPAAEPEDAAGAPAAEAPDEAAGEEPADEEPADAGPDEAVPSEASADVEEAEPAIPDAEPEPDDSPASEAEASDDGGSPPIEDAEPAEGTGGGSSTGRASDPSPTEAGGSGGPAPPGRSAGADAGQPVATEGRQEREDPDERFREEEQWRQARTVPALDPDESAPPGSEREAASQVSVDPQEPKAAPTGADEAELQALYDRVEELEAELESTTRERRQQADRVEKLIEERDELLDERGTLEARIEELEAKVEEQASRIEGQERELAEAASGGSGGSSGASASNSVDPQTALDQTDLFVRYGSKGKATLQTAHDRGASKDDVADNLRLETHSRFDPAGTTVSGRPFDDYLADTIEYRFVSWLIEELLYEIQETGSEKGLRALYDALPRIDRAEFNGTVTGVDEEGEERQETFDVVCRDRMGKPLVVANINDSLDPATGEMMGGLVESATAAGEDHESLGAAFLVTASFFEPDALETASEATGGGFLSRDSKKSFVKLSRKGGYHLSLVEARGGEFHVAVPEF